jgi:hypothetical protein
MADLSDERTLELYMEIRRSQINALADQIHNLEASSLNSETFAAMAGRVPFESEQEKKDVMKNIDAMRYASICPVPYSALEAL